MESRFHALRAVLDRAVFCRSFPGAVLAVGGSEMPTEVICSGRLAYGAGDSAVKPDTLYDLASLTKVIATASVAMCLVDQGRLSLDTPVRDLVPEFRGGQRAGVRVADLLTHSSGLPAHAPLFEDHNGGEDFIRAIARLELEGLPGERSVYSDLGFILLGVALERASGEPLESLAQTLVLDRLGMGETRFRPPTSLKGRVAPTEEDPWRRRLLVGEVHDENAHAMGGVAGHAGLFGPAGDLALFARAMLDDLDGAGRLASREKVLRFVTRASIEGTTRALGWDTPCRKPDGPRSSVPGEPGYSSAGSLLSANAFGHTGFTGTSLWIDPERRVFAVLLTNRVHPHRRNDAIRAVRAAVADAVARAVDAG